MIKQLAAALAVFLLAATTVHAQWTDNQDASRVIAFTSGSTLATMKGPDFIIIDTVYGKAYVTDYLNYRVLRFAYPFSGAPVTAELQFGTGGSAIGRTSFRKPLGTAVSNNVLYIADVEANRILRFDSAATRVNNIPQADGIIGQTSYTAGGWSSASSTTLGFPCNIFIDRSGNLWVPENGANRVTMFSNVNSKPVDGTAAADRVLGQSGFTTSGNGTSLSAMYGPYGVCVAGTTVWVTDEYNYRVLRFDNPTTDGVAANSIFGVTGSSTTSQSRFYDPQNLAVDGNGNLYVLDANRVVIFLNAASKSSGANADNVLGQSSWTANTEGGGLNGFSNALQQAGVTVDNTNSRIIITDTDNNRLLEFTANTLLPVELSRFTASASPSGVLLRWGTKTETGNSGFEIERRKVNDGTTGTQEWRRVGFVAGAGSSNTPREYSYTDAQLPAGRHAYRLKQVDNGGTSRYSQSVEVDVYAVPNDFSLRQNYPNPFNPSTQIEFSIPKGSYVTLKVYDQLGKEIATLAEGAMEAGTYTATWNARHSASGVYFCKLVAGSSVTTRKLVLLR